MYRDSLVLQTYNFSLFYPKPVHFVAALHERGRPLFTLHKRVRVFGAATIIRCMVSSHKNRPRGSPIDQLNNEGSPVLLFLLLQPG